MYLGVNRKASNIACRGELGKIPTLISIKKNIINYIKHILNLPATSVVKQLYTYLKDYIKITIESYYMRTL